jgi:hypothetical protein
VDVDVDVDEKEKEEDEQKALLTLSYLRECSGRNASSALGRLRRSEWI